MVRTIIYKDSDFEAEITVHTATIRHGLRRGFYAAQASSVETHPALKALDEITYINTICVSQGTITREGEEPKDVSSLTLEEMLDLPYSLGQKWFNAVYELNPHWRLVGEEEEDESGEGQDADA